MLFVDNANKIQGFHHARTPRAGGLGIFLSFALACYLEPFEMPFKGPFVFLGLSLVFLNGFLEDINLSLSPKIRLILQAVGVVCIISSTPLVVSDFSPLFSLPYFIAFLFAIFMLVGISNAINIIDGFNGLASGICTIVLFSILRRKIKRQKATMPDNLHLHTLLFQFLQQRSFNYPNPLCTFILILCNLPFILISVLFRLNSYALIIISLVFIACYLIGYAYLSRQVCTLEKRAF
ncbi:MraY family glycosyltransferase [Helicobacter pylori]|uniref:MraY family glycosyltransferase n=1 Tax=Helicobacter pylori TaxID=210 RepID=UPI0013F4937A|nr:glycosyltransferase [Helicobacter pylori]